MSWSRIPVILSPIQLSSHSYLETRDELEQDPCEAVILSPIQLSSHSYLETRYELE